MYSLLSCSINFTSGVLPLTWKSLSYFLTLRALHLHLKLAAMICLVSNTSLRSLHILTNFYPNHPVMQETILSSRRRKVTEEVNCLPSIIRLRSINLMIQARIPGPVVPRLSPFLCMDIHKALASHKLILISMITTYVQFLTADME